MTATFGLGETDEAYDAEFDESDEGYEEASPQRGVPRRPVPVAGRQSAYRPRPNPAASTNMVTQAQLQAALATVSNQMNTNSTAIKTLDGRVRGVSNEQMRVTTALRKEVADRKKEAEATRKDLQSTRELAALLPIIAPSNPLLGLLLMGSGGGGGSLFGGSGSGTGDSTSNMLMLALVLSPGLFNKSGTGK